MADLWELWGSGDALYEGAYTGTFEQEDDFGAFGQNIYTPEYLYGTPTEFSVGPDQYDDDTMEYGAADRFSFMATDDEGEFYDPNEPNVYPPGTSVVNLEDFRSGSGDFDDVTNYGSQLAKLAAAVGQVASSGAMNPIFGGARDDRAKRRFAQAQPGAIPGGFGQSNKGATETRFDALNRRNLNNVYAAARQTGVDVQYRLGNIPKGPSVTIPSGTIGTTSGRRRAYSKLA